MLSEFEGRAQITIQALEGSQLITPEQRLDLAYYLALQHTRTPRFEREIEGMVDRLYKILSKDMVPTIEAAQEMINRKDSLEGITAESMFKFIHEEKYSVKGSRNHMISLMLDLTQRASMELAMMDWVVVHANQGCSFVTSDSPIGYAVPEKYVRSGEPVIGLGSHKIIKLFPLTQKVALLLGKHGGGFGHFRYSRAQVRDFNLTVAKETERFLIGRDEALLRSIVKKSKIDQSSPATRMKVESVPHPTDPMRSFLVSRRVSADAPNTPLKYHAEPPPASS